MIQPSPTAGNPSAFEGKKNVSIRLVFSCSRRTDQDANLQVNFSETPEEYCPKNGGQGVIMVHNRQETTRFKMGAYGMCNFSQ
jgi:hypothetical protein